MIKLLKKTRIIKKIVFLRYLNYGETPCIECCKAKDFCSRIPISVGDSSLQDLCIRVNNNVRCPYYIPKDYVIQKTD